MTTFETVDLASRSLVRGRSVVVDDRDRDRGAEDESMTDREFSTQPSGEESKRKNCRVCDGELETERERSHGAHDRCRETKVSEDVANSVNEALDDG